MIGGPIIKTSEPQLLWGPACGRETDAVPIVLRSKPYRRAIFTFGVAR